MSLAQLALNPVLPVRTESRPAERADVSMADLLEPDQNGPFLGFDRFHGRDGLVASTQHCSFAGKPASLPEPA